MDCPLKTEYQVGKCLEGDCAWWIGGEQQECAIKSLAHSLIRNRQK